MLFFGVERLQPNTRDEIIKDKKCENLILFDTSKFVNTIYFLLVCRDEGSRNKGFFDSDFLWKKHCWIISNFCRI